MGNRPVVAKDSPESSRDVESVVPKPSFNCSSHDKNWTLEKGLWCCQHEEVGCMREVLKYNCNHLFGPWSRAETYWCCKNWGRGCPYECSDAYETWEESWPADKKLWCCENQGRGCSSQRPLPIGMNDEAGLQQERQGGDPDVVGNAGAAASHASAAAWESNDPLRPQGYPELHT